MDAICDFIDMDDIDSSIAIDSDDKNEQEKCDFIVKVKEESHKGTPKSVSAFSRYKSHESCHARHGFYSQSKHWITYVSTQVGRVPLQNPTI